MHCEPCQTGLVKNNLKWKQEVIMDAEVSLISSNTCNLEYGFRKYLYFTYGLIFYSNTSFPPEILAWTNSLFQELLSTQPPPPPPTLFIFQ